ncbi:MAG TPA: hypothetical protein VMT20_26985 [Terriglobia bacterium]|nr:hypothetical protein [Terriglobia bacterium]
MKRRLVEAGVCGSRPRVRGVRAALLRPNADPVYAGTKEHGELACLIGVD